MPLIWVILGDMLIDYPQPISLFFNEQLHHPVLHDSDVAKGGENLGQGTRACIAHNGECISVTKGGLDYVSTMYRMMALCYIPPLNYAMPCVSVA